MIVAEFRRLLLALLLLAIQVLVCSHIHYLGYATPLIYVYLLLHFPLTYPRSAILVWGFAMGLAVDLFSNTPGLAAAATTLTAMLQPVLLSHITTKEGMENEPPGPHTMGYAHYVRYMMVMVSIHHVALFMLESFTFFHLLDVTISCASSIVLTSLILWAVIHAMNRKR